MTNEIHDFSPSYGDPSRKKYMNRHKRKKSSKKAKRRKYKKVRQGDSLLNELFHKTCKLLECKVVISICKYLVVIKPSLDLLDVVDVGFYIDRTREIGMGLESTLGVPQTSLSINYFILGHLCGQFHLLNNYTIFKNDTASKLSSQ